MGDDMKTPKDQAQEALERAEKGKSGGTLREQRQATGSIPIARPKIPLIGPIIKMPSHLPKGVALTPKGDIGANRGAEAQEQKTFRGAQTMTKKKAGWGAR